ncbi:uncharacterized protein LOC135957941 [Calliphora vicina]|uniref:uncharacterized protein LOC135957941 n=1 Tax=Calliphora vicina TaxID=7373 RepID=UPI00325BA5A3
MSLAKVKAKETKGKQKLLPKLKAILANPNITKCPILDQQEMDHLKSLLQKAIKESKLEPRPFATQKGICLGLESSLRKINNQTSGCVFISLSIKPNHIISLVARNAQVKDETQPVYAQPKLENFIEELFGVQALCMVFPKNLLPLSVELNKWLEKRKKPAKIKKEAIKVKKHLKKKLIKPKKENSEEQIKADVNKEAISENVVKPWSGDFISFGKNNQVEMDDIKLDGDQAVDALSEIMDKIPISKSTIAEETEPMELDVDKDITVTKDTNALEDADVSENSDDFLSEEYKALTVHKIKGNPNKNPKKKRKKNKKKKPAN